MADEVSISQAQADLLNAGMTPALEALLATGNVFPTLFLHDGEQMRYFTFAILGLEELRQAARQVIQERGQGAVAYALFYDSAVEIDNEAIDVLIIESGDVEDDEAHEFTRRYSRADQTVAPKMGRLGPAPNLFR